MGLEYDFLRLLNNYEQMYNGLLLPVLICDTSFEAHWSNPAAKKLYPHLADTQGLNALLGEFDRDDLLARLKRGDTVIIDGALAFSGVRLNLVPMLADGEVKGVVAILIGPQAVVTPQEILQISKTPHSLEKSIRQSVEAIFETMDAAAYKADMLESGWIKSSFNDIAQCSYYILRIAASISNYASFQLHPPELKFASRDIFSEIRRNEPVISGLAEGMGISVVFSLPDEESIVGIDIDKFQFAFYNILHNSFYYTRPGNKVEITGVAGKDNVSLTIRDNGIGISGEIFPKIFKPYFSYRPGGKSEGVGLGLTLAKIIIEAHGGNIDITSIENEGTEVTVTIPKNIFSRRISLGQSHTEYDSADRFSPVYVGLVGAAGSPYQPPA